MKKTATILIYLALILAVASAIGQAQTIPKLSVEVGKSDDAKDLSVTLQIVLLMTVLTLAPSIILMVTSFIRLVVVLGFLRQAMGTQQLPPNQLLLSLALILTFFIISPAVTQGYNEGLKPYLDGTITKEEALEKGTAPFKKFMLAQTREKDLALFISLSDSERPATREDVSFTVLIPAFVLSELRTGFQIAFLIFVPFLVIDMIVASVLMSMGMMMLPPIMVSLPFKILLFVMVDGWYLLVKSLVESFY